jgi:hypothetical protein
MNPCIALVSSLVVVAMANAPLAAADPNEFLDELSTLNIHLPDKDAAGTIAAGYDTCFQLRGGTSVLDEMGAVEEKYQLPTGQGTLFVSAATTNLCADFANPPLAEGTYRP